ncbi:MAG TPA: hypothetical protein PLG59_12325 [bacterium]|nr:hypothetical protein [bacterium]HQP98589.1 hypothetical protein [bacterium]
MGFAQKMKVLCKRSEKRPGEVEAADEVRGVGEVNEAQRTKNKKAFFMPDTVFRVCA